MNARREECREVVVRRLNALRATGKRSLVPVGGRIVVGMGTCGRAAGAQVVYDICQQLSERETLAIQVDQVGCMGACWAEPLVGVILPRSRSCELYGLVDEGLAERIVRAVRDGRLPEEHRLGRISLDDLEAPCPPEGVPFKGVGNRPIDDFFLLQKRRTMRRCGIVDPRNASQYAATGGFRALSSLLCGELEPEQVIRLLKDAGLRGRGGAGFPAGDKWELVYLSREKDACIVGNADEGDPGAFMDRCLLESDPFAVIEGMLVAAYVLQTNEGYLFTRSEYRQAVATLEAALSDARSQGLLGKDILGSGFSFDISLVRSPGAYVCGESTALVRALEGKAARPRNKPPHVAQRGLWGRPTLLNNVETFASVADVMAEGPEWFRAVGTSESPGTKVFSLAGNIGKPGLVEVPLGIELKSVLDAATSPTRGLKVRRAADAYGFEGLRGHKAAQVGGPSGAILSMKQEHHLDYEAVGQVGGALGSGGIVFLGEDCCIVDTVRFFMDYAVREDCGQCNASHALMERAVALLDRLTCGRGTLEDVSELGHLCKQIPAKSLCGLGKMAVNPLASALESFFEEFVAHVEGRCPSRVCRSLVRFHVREDLCPGCRCCAPVCPTNAMQGRFGHPYHIVERLCIRCRMCVSSCPYQAVVVQDVSGAADENAADLLVVPDVTKIDTSD